MLKRVLVFGGAGFIGANLCRRLLEEGSRVICADSLITGTRDNILALESHENFSFILQDVCEPFDCPVDEIYNLACPASPPQYKLNPLLTAKTSFMGAWNLLELASKYNAKILQASTSEIYGDPLVHPQPEEYRGNVNPIGHRACYNEGKRIAETLFFDHFRTCGTRIKIVRIFNVYGPYMCGNDGRVVSNFILQALRKEPITIYGDGTQTRSFCYVSDLVDGLVRFMGTDDTITGPVNLGNPQEISILQLAQEIMRLTGNNPPIVFLPLSEDDPVKRQPVIEQAKLLFDWSPRVPLEEGLSRTIAYFRKL